ncbi:hypothetical protein BGX31_002606 [Mortierella sp. GBA43]|nr:hypothetical protein BGX31_002606 [Mortierella sp. GBA43]
MTAHRGYTLKYPKDTEHRNREIIKRTVRVVSHIVRGAEAAGGFVGNVSSHPGNFAMSVLTSLEHKVENRARLNRAGIDPKNMFVPQFITDEHQKEAMEELLRKAAASNGDHSITGNLTGIDLHNGRTIWVCDRCLGSLRRGDPIDERSFLALSQYKPLIMREPKVEVILRNSVSVIVFNEIFAKSSKTTKIVIHIEPAYFEAPERSTGACRNSITHLFNDLGQAIANQKALTHLEIHGRSITDGGLYVGLQAVLKCPSLKALHVSGISCFLQGEKIALKSKRLKELTLQGVTVDSVQAENNLGTLLLRNTGLGKLEVSQPGLPSQFLINHFAERPDMMRRLTRLW